MFCVFPEVSSRKLQPKNVPFSRKAIVNPTHFITDYAGIGILSPAHSIRTAVVLKMSIFQCWYRELEMFAYIFYFEMCIIYI